LSNILFVFGERCVYVEETLAGCSEMLARGGTMMVFRSATKKVLLVDDSTVMLMMERALLEKEPYTLVSAMSGQEAVTVALAEQPDLILMDVVMPGMDGFEACRRLRSEGPTRKTPIILVTTRGSHAHIERGYESGCTDYVIKPFDAAVLRAKIASLVGQ
jgi:CheY-like chemotaxis protein